MSIYIGRQSDSRGKSYCRLILLKASVLNFEGLDILRVKIYCHLILLRASVLNFEHLDILRDTIGHPSKKFLSFDFAQSFRSEIRASRYTSGHNRTFE